LDNATDCFHKGKSDDPWNFAEDNKLTEDSEKNSLEKEKDTIDRLKREEVRSIAERQCWSHTRTQCIEKQRADRTARAANAVVVAAASEEPAALPVGGLVLTKAMTVAKRRRVATPQSQSQGSQSSGPTQSSGPSSLSLSLSLPDPFSGMTLDEMN